jgi:dihydropyrimidinase
MSQLDLVIKNGKLVIPQCGITEGSIGVKEGRVAAILAPSEEVSAKKEIDVGGKYVLPGVIDPHSHPGYPKGTFDEAFDTETAAAAIGGVTTPVVFYRQYGVEPSPYEDFWDVMKKAEAKSHVDFGVHLMISVWSQVASGQYRKYADEYGVRSFKYSMAYKGAEGKALGIINDVDDAFLYDSFSQLSRIPGCLNQVHCENMAILTMLSAPLKAQGRQDLAAWTEGRPDFVEAESVRRILYLAEVANCPSYVVHVTCKAAMEEIIRHRERKTAPVYAETCTQYLTHTKDSPIGAFGKVNPPLRTQEDIDFLWQAIANGDVDTIGTDHCHLVKTQKKDLLKSLVSTRRRERYRLAAMPISPS